jgi:hypothetical protein
MGRLSSREVRSWTQHRQMDRDLDVGKGGESYLVSPRCHLSFHFSLTCPSLGLTSASHVVTLRTNFLRKLEQTAKLLD